MGIKLVVSRNPLTGIRCFLTKVQICEVQICKGRNPLTGIRCFLTGYTLHGQDNQRIVAIPWRGFVVF